MKSFMEEYGIVVVVAIVIVALILIATAFKTSGSQSIVSMLNNFLTKGGAAASIGGSNVNLNTGA